MNSDDQIAQAFSLLSENQKQSILQEILARLQLDMQGNTFKDQYVSGYQYGGQAQGSVPLGIGDLLFGLRGQAFSVDTPIGKFGDRGISGGDIGYRFGPNELRASYDSQSMVPTPIGGIPTEDAVRLLYRREF